MSSPITRGPDRSVFAIVFVCSVAALAFAFHALGIGLAQRAAFCALGALAGGVLLATIANDNKVDIALRMHVVTGMVATRNAQRLTYELKRVAAGKPMAFDEFHEHGSVGSITESAYDDLQPELERVETFYRMVGRTAWAVVAVSAITTVFAVATL